MPEILPGEVPEPAPDVVRGGVLLGGTFFLPPSGTRSVSQGLADQLRQRGWRVVTTSSIRNKPLRLIDMPLTAARQRRNYQVAHVDVFSGLGFLWAEATCMAVAAAGRPYLLTLRGGLLPSFARRHPYRFARLLKGAHRVFAPSAFLQREFAEFRSDIEVLPNPIAIDAYPAQERAGAKPKMTWLRAFTDTYNPEMAVRVAKLLAQRFPDLELDLVGPLRDAAVADNVRRLIRELGVQDRVHVKGPVAKQSVPEVLAAADIFLNTSRIDNMPVSVLEAMACGLCVVSTNVGGISTMLSHGKNALLVENDDAEAMAASVGRLLEDPAMCYRLSTAARQFAEAHDWQVLLPQWERAFTEARGAPPA